MNFNTLFLKKSDSIKTKEKVSGLVKIVANYSNKLSSKYYKEKIEKKKLKLEKITDHYFLKYLKACKFSESVYIRRFLLIQSSS